MFLSGHRDTEAMIESGAQPIDPTSERQSSRRSNTSSHTHLLDHVELLDGPEKGEAPESRDHGGWKAASLRSPLEPCCAGTLIAKVIGGPPMAVWFR